MSAPEPAGNAARAPARARGNLNGFRPLLEDLEDRLAPAIHAVLSGTTLNVTLTANDLARFAGNGEGNISVENEAFTGVRSINITGNSGFSPRANDRLGPRGKADAVRSASRG